jgi:hypothetical protein
MLALPGLPDCEITLHVRDDTSLIGFVVQLVAPVISSRLRRTVFSGEEERFCSTPHNSRQRRHDWLMRGFRIPRVSYDSTGKRMGKICKFDLSLVTSLVTFAVELGLTVPRTELI